jgi:hypothetical protein
MTTFEWFLLIVIVIVVPLIIAAVVTLWTIDQANKRKRANRNDAQIGVKRKAALSPEEVAARKIARAEKQEAEAGTVTINNVGADTASSETFTSETGNVVTINNVPDDVPVETDPDASQALPGRTT